MKSEQLRVDFLLFAFAVNTMGKRIYSNSPKFSPKSLNVHWNAPDKNCKWSLLIVIYQANIYYSDQNLFGEKGFMKYVFNPF